MKSTPIKTSVIIINRNAYKCDHTNKITVKLENKIKKIYIFKCIY